MTDKKETPREPKPLVNWTVMIYMAGDNNLSADCVWALTEMIKLKRLGNVNIIAQFDPSDGRARTRRYEITSPEVQAYDDDNRERPLADFAVDFASFNPRTEEVHFGLESKKANILAIRRKQRREADAEKIVSEEAVLNAGVAPDLLGSSLHDTNTASPVTLYNFLSYGVQFYPARHYMVVLSAHSGGVEPSYLMKDESSGGYMSFRELKLVLDQLKFDLTDPKVAKDGRAGSIDILGFDSCLMSMAEICYELKGHVKTVVGSETYTPSSGWPYLSILQTLTECATGSSNGHAPEPSMSEETAKSPLGQPENGASDANELAIQIVDSYVKFYRDYAEAGVAVALSAMNVEVMPDLIPLVKKLTYAMIGQLREEHPELNGKRGPEQRPFTDALILAHWEAQSYNGEWYVDLVDFCECLQKRWAQGPIFDACKDVVEFVDNKLVIKSAFTGPDYQFSRGVSVYFPWSTVAPYLFQYEFAEESGWGEFLAYYTNLTRRKFRVPDNPTPAQEEQIRLLEKFGGNFLNYLRKDKDNTFKSDVMEFNKMGSDKMGSDKMGSDKMGSDKMGSDKMGSDKSGNPIHSMRNPPLIWIEADTPAQVRAKTATKTG